VYVSVPKWMVQIAQHKNPESPKFGRLLIGHVV